MRLYLDASVLVPLFVEEPGTARARALIEGNVLLIGDFAAGEFSAAISRRTRTDEIPAADAAAIFAALDSWSSRAATRIELVGQDGPAAMELVRRFDLGLRTPDALHIAIARRIGAALATFDVRMAMAAQSLGVSVVPALA